jgi:hypothetical protein
MARVGVAEIVARREGDTGAIEHGAAVGVGLNGIARRGQVGPRRKERCRSRERNAGFTKREQEREREAASSGFTRNHDVLGRIARAEKRALKGNGIFDGGGKAIFGREPIVRGKHVEAVERVERGDGTMSFRGAGEIAAAVQIEEHRVTRRRALDAFAGDTTEMSRRDLDCGWNLVRIRAQDFARDAIVPYAFQTALNAPFDDPHRNPRLKAD